VQTPRTKKDDHLKYQGGQGEEHCALRVIPVQDRVNVGESKSVGTSQGVVEAGEGRVAQTQRHRLVHVHQAHWVGAQYQVHQRYHQVGHVLPDVYEVNKVDFCKTNNQQSRSVI